MGKVKRFLSRPSPGTVLGTVAIFMALSGIAIGNLPGKNSVISSDIKADNVKGVDVKEASLGDVPSADSAENSEDTLWAVVNNPPGAGNATLARGSGGVTVAEATGVQVRFPREVQSCAWNATNGLVAGGGAATPGWAQVNGIADSNVVEVRTRDAAGTITDQPFHLVVAC